MGLVKIIVKMVKFLKVDKTSQVSSGANGVSIRSIWQSNDKRPKDSNEYKFDVKLVQTDDEKRVAYTVVHEAEIVDFQGKVFSTDVLTQACNEFSKGPGAKGTNFNHRFDEDGKTVISDESNALIVQNFMLMSDNDPRFPGIYTPAWVQVREYPKSAEKEWQLMKNGEVPYISLEGYGSEEEIEIEIEESLIRKLPTKETQNNDSTGNSATQNLKEDTTIESRLSFIERALQKLGIKPKITKEETNDMKKEEIVALLDTFKTELKEEFAQQNTDFEAKLAEFEDKKKADDENDISLEDFKKTVLENIQNLQTNFDSKLEKIAQSAQLGDDLGTSEMSEDFKTSLSNVYGFGSIEDNKGSK